MSKKSRPLESQPQYIRAIVAIRSYLQQYHHFDFGTACRLTKVVFCDLWFPEDNPSLQELRQFTDTCMQTSRRIELSANGRIRIDKELTDEIEHLAHHGLSLVQCKCGHKHFMTDEELETQHEYPQPTSH